MSGEKKNNDIAGVVMYSEAYQKLRVQQYNITMLLCCLALLSLFIDKS